MTSLILNNQLQQGNMNVSNRTKVFSSSEMSGTVKFQNFRTPDIFAVIYLKFKQRGQALRVFCQNGANGIANSEDPDQTAPLGAV